MNKELTLVEPANNCCTTDFKPTVSADYIKQTADLFAALGDSTRLAIMNLLAANGSEVCVCDITASFKLGQPTISHHLRILREAGLITGDKRGKWVYYSLVASRVNEIKATLDQLVKVSALV